jgi:hypothetical protein
VFDPNGAFQIEVGEKGLSGPEDAADDVLRGRDLEAFFPLAGFSAVGPPWARRLSRAVCPARGWGLELARSGAGAADASPDAENATVSVMMASSRTART